MSFFRPGNVSSSDEESSSSADEEEVEVEPYLNDVSQESAKDSTGTVELTEQEPATDTLSYEITRTISGDNGTLQREQLRDLAIASMLEEFSRYKAAALMNDASTSGKLFNKDSPEVQELAGALFSHSSGMFEQGGLLSAESASDANRGRRQNFLTGLSSLGPQHVIPEQRTRSIERGRPGGRHVGSTALIRRESQQPPAPFQGTIKGQFQQLNWEMNSMNIVRSPSTELRMTPLVRSRYLTNFEERGMLGRGGFGRVYQAFNMLDQRTYAIKKIPLSPRLAQRYLQNGQIELEHVLREAQVLARLEHPNVVRYFATWLEEPTMTSPVNRSQPLAVLSRRGQMLLDNQAAPSSPPEASRVLSSSVDLDFSGPFKKSRNSQAESRRQRIISASSQDVEDSFDPFARSRSGQEDGGGKLLWSVQSSQAASRTRPRDSETHIFTDDNARSSSIMSHMDDVSSHVLYVQMSMYPLTLAEYLLPPASPRRSSHSISFRHCFHIVPALRILLSILCGLQYIHSQGLLHRDIKPSNIFLSVTDFAPSAALSMGQGYADIGSCPSCINASPRFVNPRIGDFGLVAELARLHDASHERSGSDANSASRGRLVGTEFYRPPTHGSNADTVDEGIDVFALGVILLELLWSCNTRMERIDLLKGAQKGHVSGLKEKVIQEGLPQTIAGRLEECIRGMIDIDPQQRWRCDTVKDSIEEVLKMIPRETIAG